MSKKILLKAKRNQTYEQNRKNGVIVLYACRDEYWDMAINVIKTCPGFHTGVTVNRKTAAQYCLSKKNYSVLQLLIPSLSANQARILFREAFKTDEYEPIQMLAARLVVLSPRLVALALYDNMPDKHENVIRALVDAKADVFYNRGDCGVMHTCASYASFVKRLRSERVVKHSKYDLLMSNVEIVIDEAVRVCLTSLMEMFDEAETGMIPELVDLALQYHSFESH